MDFWTDLAFFKYTGTVQKARQGAQGGFPTYPGKQAKEQNARARACGCPHPPALVSQCGARARPCPCPFALVLVVCSSSSALIPSPSGLPGRAVSGPHWTATWGAREEPRIRLDGGAWRPFLYLTCGTARGPRWDEACATRQTHREALAPASATPVQSSLTLSAPPLDWPLFWLASAYGRFHVFFLNTSKTDDPGTSCHVL